MEASMSVVEIINSADFVYKSNYSDRYYPRFSKHTLKGYEIIRDTEFLNSEKSVFENRARDDMDFMWIHFAKSIVFFGSDKVELGEVELEEDFLTAYNRVNQVGNVKYICLTEGIFVGTVFDYEPSEEIDNIYDSRYRIVRIYELAK